MTAIPRGLPRLNRKIVLSLGLILIALLLILFRAYGWVTTFQSPAIITLAHESLVVTKGFGKSGGGLQADAFATLAIPVSTKTAFQSSVVQINTSPNAFYRILVTTKSGGRIVVAEDSFFENYVIDLIGLTKNRGSYTLLIEAEKRDQTPAIHSLKLINTGPTPYSFVVQLGVSLLALGGAWIMSLITGFLSPSLFAAAILALGVLSVWFGGTLPFVFYWASGFGALAAAWGLGALARGAFARRGAESPKLEQLWQRLKDAENTDGLGTFLLGFGVFYLAVLAIIFRGFELNQVQVWQSGEASGPVHAAFWVTAVVALAVFCPLRKTEEGGLRQIVYRLDKRVFDRAIIWVPVTLLLGAFYTRGANVLITDFGNVAPDAHGYFINISKSWVAFFDPTAYREPLLSYINKALFSLLGLPVNINFMAVTSFIFFLFSGLITVALAERAFNNRYAAVVAAAFALLTIAAASTFGIGPITYMKQGIRLFPFTFLLAATAYAAVCIGRSENSKERLWWGVALGTTAALTCLLRNESLFFLPLFMGLGWALWPKAWKAWGLALVLFAVLFGPYQIREAGDSQARNIPATAKIWRNVEFQNQVGQNVTPELQKHPYSGTKIGTLDYFIKDRPITEVFAYTLGGYYRSIVDGQFSYLLLGKSWNKRHWYFWVPLGILTILGLSLAGARALWLGAALAILALLPNAFMNHIGSSPRHNYHVWPFLILLSTQGILFVAAQFGAISARINQPLRAAWVAAIGIMVVLPAMIPEVLTLNRQEISQNRYKNHVRGSRFQKHAALSPTPGAPGQWESAPVYFPKGDGFVALDLRDIPKITGATLTFRYLDQMTDILVTQGQSVAAVPFRTERVVKSPVTVSIRGASVEKPPVYVKVSSSLAKEP